MTITPPLWGVIAGFALVVYVLFRLAMREEAKQVRADELAAARAGLRRRPVRDDQIDHDYADQ